MNPSNSFDIEATQTPDCVGGDQALLAETDGDFIISRSNEEEAPTIGSSGIDTSVLTAAENGDIAALQKHSNNLHQILTPTNNTVLHIYIANIKSEEEEQNSTNIVKQILDMCPSLLLQPNDNGDIALHIATRDGRAAIVEVLIEAARDPREDPENVGVEQVRQMLRTTNKEKVTAMHEAVRFKQPDVLTKLTKLEDPDFAYSANEDGETPLYLAVERGYDDLVDEILNACPHSAYGGRSGRTALHAAVICNNEGMTSKLLKCTKLRAMTKAVDEQGWTPLHFAAFLGRLSIVKQLLECDKSAAYIGDKYCHMTALHVAASERHVHVMEMLISWCPDCCELIDRRRRNVLHHAFKNGLYKVHDFVLNKKWLGNILLNGKDVDGNTPLHELASSLRTEFFLPGAVFDILTSNSPIAKFLLDARVDKLALNKKNLNFLDILAANDDIAPFLKLVVYKLTLETVHGARPGHHQIIRDEESKIKGVQEKGDTDLLRTVKEANLIVATLIATVTFAAGFTVPGGYQSEKGPDQGWAVLIRNTAFQAFVITNTMAMAMSSCSVMICFFLSFRKDKQVTEPFLGSVSFTSYALIAMVIAFLTGTYSVLGHSAPRLAITACVLGCIFFFFYGTFLFIPNKLFTILKKVDTSRLRRCSW